MSSKLIMNIGPEQGIATNFTLFYIINDGLSFSKNCIFSGIIIKDSIYSGYLVSFNKDLNFWNPKDLNFVTIEDIKNYFEQDQNILRKFDEYVLSTVSDSTKGELSYINESFKIVYKTILHELNYHSIKTPNIIYQDEFITISQTRSKTEEVSLYERAPMRIMDICIYWHGIGAVLFKVNQNHLTGKVTMIPIALYRYYDQTVRFWNDQRKGYILRPDSPPYNEAIWRHLFNEINRGKQLELLKSFDSIKEMSETIQSETFLSYFKSEYFWKIAEMMKSIECAENKTSFDILYDAYNRS